MCMGNDSSLIIAGISKIKLRMFDGVALSVAMFLKWITIWFFFLH